MAGIIYVKESSLYTSINSLCVSAGRRHANGGAGISDGTVLHT